MINPLKHLNASSLELSIVQGYFSELDRLNV